MAGETRKDKGQGETRQTPDPSVKGGRRMLYRLRRVDVAGRKGTLMKSDKSPCFARGWGETGASVEKEGN